MDAALTYLFTLISCVIFGLDYIESCSPRPPVTVWTKELFPNLRTDTDEDYCKRYCQRSWICNPDDIITENEGDELDQKIEEIRSSGVCGCEDECFGGGEGYSIAIAILSRIKVENGFEMEDAMEDFANYLRRTKWNYGKCGNNVVIVVASEQRRIQISTGPAAIRVLTNQCVNHIREEVTDSLKQEDYKTALDHLVTKFGEVFRDRKCNIDVKDQPKEWQTWQKVLMGLVSIFVFAVVVDIIRRRKEICKPSEAAPTKLHKQHSSGSFSSISSNSHHSCHDVQETNVDCGDGGTNANDGGGGDGEEYRT